MKILEQPPPAAEWKTKFLCTSCGALLEVETGDVRIDRGDSQPFYIVCPCCQTSVRLTCGIPKDVQEAVKALSG